MSILISVTTGEVTTTDFRTAAFSTGEREYNMTGWHVSPLHHGAATVYWNYFLLIESSKGDVGVSSW